MSISDFASLAVVTATGFIAIAISRSFTTTSGVVLGAREGVDSTSTLDARRTLVSSAAIAVLTGAGIYLWMASIGQPHAVHLALVAGCLVLADAPRQCLIVGGKYFIAFIPSSLYALAALAVLIFLPELDAAGLFLAWGSVLLFLGVLGWSLLAGSRTSLGRWRVPNSSSAWKTSVSLAVEAGYFGLAGQFGLLILFATSADAATAALRVSYSLVFAPAFSIVQGLAPLVVRRLSALAIVQDFRGVAKTVWVWAVAVLGTAVLAGVGSLVWLPLIDPSTELTDLVPFLLPVGLSLVAGQALETSVIALRLVSPGNRVHFQRTVLASVDIAVQAVSVLAFGTWGLVVGITLMAVCRIFITISYTRRVLREG